MLTGLLLITASLVGQAGTESPELGPAVQRLVRQLDAAELARRVEAEEKLIEFGPTVLDLLPQPTATTPPEVRQRLARIAKTLQTQLVEDAVRARVVTLQGEMTLGEAIEGLKKQTGNEVTAANQETKVKVQFQETPFWIALDELLDQAQLTVNIYGGQPNALVVQSRPDQYRSRAGNAAYEAIFRFEAVQVNAVRDLRNPDLAGLRLLLEIAWEPRVTPISLSLPLDKIKATDANGEKLATGREGVVQAVAQGGISGVEVELPFSLPERKVQRIAELSGELQALVPGKVEKFQFEKLTTAKNVTQSRGGVTVLLEDVRKNGAVEQVRIRVKFDEASHALESHRGWVYENEAYVLSSEGKREEHAGYEETFRSENEIGLAYNFVPEGGLNGYAFVYETPAALVKLPVPFTLKSIDLP